MVGIFSRLSVGRASHRRTQSALQDDREALPPSTELAGSEAVASAVAPHGIQVTVEFKPVEHPIEPLDNDQPIQCPVPEPSILNDGRIWKERVSATVRRRNDLPVMREDGGGTPEPESAGPRRPPPMRSSNRLILPSVSAPEHNLLKLLEECNASGI
ncbi:unnamed protein product [Linum tenue]|uniref:Cystic fibrosis transmembrane conductance regulator n=1 Tax=Linum tenue TaxID=586396 RepID=A0AAV0PK78_9ROSI|nr:unnamed protein product [Linum tenue]